MILAKQLELQDSNQGATPTPTPRSNLAKELEKYNRPTVEIQAPLSSKPVPAVVVSTQSASQTSVPDRSSSSSSGSNHPKPPRARDAPDRPNILSRRPHFKPRYSYIPTPSSTLSSMVTGYSPSPPTAVTASATAASGGCSMASGVGEQGLMQAAQPQVLPVQAFGQGPMHVGAGPPTQGASLPASAMVQAAPCLATLSVPQPMSKTLTANSAIMNAGAGSSSPHVFSHDAGGGMGSYSG